MVEVEDRLEFAVSNRHEEIAHCWHSSRGAVQALSWLFALHMQAALVEGHCGPRVVVDTAQVSRNAYGRVGPIIQLLLSDTDLLLVAREDLDDTAWALEDGHTLPWEEVESMVVDAMVCARIGRSPDVPCLHATTRQQCQFKFSIDANRYTCSLRSRLAGST